MRVSLKAKKTLVLKHENIHKNIHLGLMVNVSVKVLWMTEISETNQQIQLIC